MRSEKSNSPGGDYYWEGGQPKIVGNVFVDDIYISILGCPWYLGSMDYFTPI